MSGKEIIQHVENKFRIKITYGKIIFTEKLFLLCRVVIVITI